MSWPCAPSAGCTSSPSHGTSCRDSRANATDYLGFAIERSELRQGQVIERYFLRGIKRFKFKDEGLAPGTPMPTSEHPIQSFQWGDYTVKPGTTYRYRVVPVYGKPKLIDLDEASATTVEISTEAEEGGAGNGGQPVHDIYFNRGVAGSQAYARKFPDTRPDEMRPESDQMKWLSRGLFEALTAFIARAAGADAKTTSFGRCSMSSAICRSARPSPRRARPAPMSPSATRPSRTRTRTRR